MTDTERDGVWWGKFEIAPGEAGRWKVGPLRLWADNRELEWVIATESSTDSTETEIEFACPTPPSSPPAGSTIRRFATRQTGGQFWLTPLLADRPIVARPEVPFSLLPDEELTLYLSTTVWVRLEVGEQRQPLVELPTLRASDTWFGTSTREGELCYASRTTARLNRENLSPHPSRAVTTVLLHNRADDILVLERIALPVPALSLFRDAEGGLWTESISVERTRDGKMGELKLARSAPNDVTQPSLVSEARIQHPQNVLVRTLSSWLR